MTRTPRRRPRATLDARLDRLARASRALGRRVHGGAAASAAALTGLLRPIATVERALPIAVASIVGVGGLLAVLPATPQGAVGGVEGAGTGIRIAISGAGDESIEGPQDRAGEAPARGDVAGLRASAAPSFQPVTLPADVVTEPGSEQATIDGPVLDDGTLLTGYAPLTEVEDGADLIRTYRVRSGDTLVTIADKFDVSMMTLWWANRLKRKDDLHIGQVLRIPPVSGLVYTVRDTDTLPSLADRYDIKAADIVELNGLDDPTLVVGQVLVLPGASGAPIPTPKPKPKHRAAAHSPSRTTSGPARYTGGNFRWPVVGGNNYVSQYFHYGHYAIDIAATWGTPVVAAAGGRVQFAGWKSNGGGYQVWISHGSGLYTTYNHMSSLTVGTGQSVGRGQQVGRIGQTGLATGPHLHFEVWIGPIWNGGHRVNPLRYL